MLLQTDVYTILHTVTQAPLYTDAFTDRRFYKQTLLNTNAFRLSTFNFQGACAMRTHLSAAARDLV